MNIMGTGRERSDPELAQAPAITPDELQRLDDPEFERRVHGYYGQEPGQLKEQPNAKSNYECRTRNIE
jgi:hypothetical protein